jgi:1-acyl-sn-glycerol-3-phosphate acyltransferase
MQRLHAAAGEATQIVALTADVGDEDDVARVLDQVRSTLPPLRGIIHAAMVLDDATLDELDRDRLVRGMHAKVLGAWHLHQLTDSDPLDLFVCFSSIAALLGNAAQGGYAAANAFLEALAHHRRALGRPALTVDWGVISDAGFVARHRDLAKYLEGQGYRSFPADQALAALGCLLRQDYPQAMAARIDWRRWAAGDTGRASSSRLGHFAPREDHAAPSVMVELAKLLAQPEPERLPAVIDYVRTQVGHVLGVNPAAVELDRALPNLGLDSLIAVELAAVLQLHLGVELPLIRLLQDTTVTDVGRLVLERAEATAAAASTAAPAASSTAASAVGPLHRQATAPMARASTEYVAAAPTGSSYRAANAPAPNAPAVSRERRPPNVGGDGSFDPRHEPQRVLTAASNDPDSVGKWPSRYERLDYRRWSPSQRVVRRTLAAALHSVASVTVEGADHLATPGPYILALNHLAVIDVPLVVTVLPRPAIVFAASKFRRYRVVDWFLSDLGNAIYVDRGMGDAEVIEQGLTVLRAGGVLGLSPEGRVSQTGGLERAHSGVAYLAAGAQVPVVPMAVWGQEALADRLRHGHRTPVRVAVGPPLDPPPTEASSAGRVAFTNHVMETIAALLPTGYRGVYGDAVPSGVSESGA